MRRASLLLGLVVLASVWAAPLIDGGGSFTARMAAHLGTVAFAAPLLAIGLAGSRLDVSGRHAWLGPVPASLVELLVVWLWHVPALRALAPGSWPMAILEQGSFLLAGLLLWLACLGRPRTDARRQGVRFLLLTPPASLLPSHTMFR